jgi:hypothetical protein
MTGNFPLHEFISLLKPDSAKKNHSAAQYAGPAGIEQTYFFIGRPEN